MKRVTLSFLTGAVDIFRLLLKNTLTIVLTTTFWPSTLWFSQVKLQHLVVYERAFLAAFLEVSYDWLIRIFSVALNTSNASHTSFTRFGEGIVSPIQFKIIRYSWCGFSMYLEPIISILQQEVLLFFFSNISLQYSLQYVSELLYYQVKSMSVSSEIPRELISVFSFMISISPGQLILISSSISIPTFKIFWEHIVSFKPTRKRSQLICIYWPKHLSKRSLWKPEVSMKSYPSSNKSSIRLAWHLQVRIKALAVDRESELFKWWNPQFSSVMIEIHLGLKIELRS